MLTPTKNHGLWTTLAVTLLGAGAANAALEQQFSGQITNEPFAFDAVAGIGVSLPMFDPTSVPEVNPLLTGITLSLDATTTISYSILNQTGSPKVYSVTGNALVGMLPPSGITFTPLSASTISAANVPTVSGVPASGSLPATSDQDTTFLDDSLLLDDFIGNGSLFFPMTGEGGGDATGDLPFIAGFTGVASADVTITYHYISGQTDVIPEGNALYAILACGIPFLGLKAYRRFGPRKA